VESEVSIHSLSLSLCSCVKIDYLPFLVGSLMVLPNDDLSSFFILSSMNIKCLLVSDVDELFLNISEDLEPS